MDNAGNLASQPRMQDASLYSWVGDTKRSSAVCQGRGQGRGNRGANGLQLWTGGLL
jgi:hypothetical protein